MFKNFSPEDQDLLYKTAQKWPQSLYGFLAQRKVELLPVGHEKVPERLAKDIRKHTHSSFSSSTPSVCHLDGAGRVFVVLGSQKNETIGHELIHAAQVFASPKAMQDSFSKVVMDGQLLVEKARNRVRAGEPAENYRDLTWIKIALKTTPDLSKRDKTPLPEKLMSTWNLHRMVHPINTTKELGLETLPDKDAVAAAMFAPYLEGAKLLTPQSDVHREIVAYRFQHDVQALDGLFQDASVHRSKDKSFSR